MEIAKPSLASADTLVSLWMDLAAGQRDYGSHLLIRVNEPLIRDMIGEHIATGRVFVARDDSIVGFVTFTVERTAFEQDVDRGIVENLYVAPEYRDDGVGTALLEAAEDDLRDRGVDAIALEAMADNEAGREFYRANGYQPHRIEVEKSIDDDA
jgi:ribosomal protein S18 acetylase RimI-like enzyme